MNKKAALLQLLARTTPRDHELLYAVRDFLDQHYAAPPSLLELAHQFGTNDFKLKKGFRELFGTTVFGYIAELRLTVARQLLTCTDQPVHQIAEFVGFHNPGYFATAFRRRFRHSPLQARRLARLRLADGAGALQP